MRIHRHIIPHSDNNHRPLALRCKALLVYAGIFLIIQIVLSYTTFTSPKVVASTITTGQIINLTNSARSSHNLPALKTSGALNNAASKKAIHMLKHNYWSHTAPDGTTPWHFITSSGYNYLYAGENLAKDFIDANSVIAAWLASTSHRNNILNNHYKDMGVAIVEGALQGKQTILVVQMFGQQAAQASQPSLEVPSPSQSTSNSDITPPEPPEILKPKDGTITNSLRLKIEGIAEKGSEVGVYDGNQKLGSIPADPEGSFTYKTQKDLSENLHTFSADATDATGNTSMKSDKVGVIIDITPAKIVKRSLKLSSESTRQGERYEISIKLEETAESVILTVYDYSLMLELVKCDIETAIIPKVIAETDKNSKTCFIYSGSFIPPQDSLQRSRGTALIVSYDEAGNIDEYEFNFPTKIALATSSYINNSFLKRFFQNPESALINMFLALTLATLFIVDSLIIFKKNVVRQNSHSSAHFLLILTAILAMLFLQNGNII